MDILMAVVLVQLTDILMVLVLVQLTECWCN